MPKTIEQKPKLNASAFRYMELADTLEAQIRDSTFRAGEKLPSLRRVHRRTGLSISTVYQAFIELEKRGMVEPRQKSGYFVRPLMQNTLPPPQTPKISLEPQIVTVNNLAYALMEAMGNPDVLQLGGALISPDLLPGKALADIFKTAPLQSMERCTASYENYMGLFDLRRRIAQRSATLFGNSSADEMVITNGCMEAVSLCIQAVARAGDAILVESPTFPWILQILEDFKLFALEIPSDPRTGVQLDTLQKAIRHHAVKACIFIPNFNNPLGFLMPDDKKQALVALMNEHEIPIIEDDIYGDLYFTVSRPVPLKFFDRKGLVLYCSSFSKTLSPGLRLGWTQPGRFLDRVKRLKLNQTICGPTLTQWGLARYLKDRSYDRHLRKLRTCLKNQVSNTAQAVARYFPKGTKISAPQGGLTLWMQLDRKVDSLALFRLALAANIAVLPGIICASRDTFCNCIRISCGMPYNTRIDQGLKTLAGIIRELE